MTQDIAPIEELSGVDAADVLEHVKSERPIVFRQLVQWPLIQEMKNSLDQGIRYLASADSGTAVNAFVGHESQQKRIFYTDGLAETNFRHIRTSLPGFLQELQKSMGKPDAPALYMGSVVLDQVVPSIAQENSLPLGQIKKTVRIWIGNRTTVAAHYDTLDNIAVVCAGRRRFTLFPPHQLPNLYVGPIDFTPAGQAISLVDFDQPDFEAHPRFREALTHATTALLEPGDAIFIPSMWWHHVRALDDFNILINHWWRDVPAHMGPPADALLHAILNIRDLPPAQRQVWSRFFDYYVFNADTQVTAHIPPPRRGLLGDIDEDTARRIRATLRANLNR